MYRTKHSVEGLLRASMLVSLGLTLAATTGATPGQDSKRQQTRRISTPTLHFDSVGDDGLPIPVSKVSVDTIWVADWSFDGAGGGGCTDAGWAKIDNRILNDGTNYWQIRNDWAGTGSIQGNAAALTKHDPCWAGVDGYGNNWDYSIRLLYQGAPALFTFDYLLDTDTYDELRVEADSACSSFARVDYVSNPGAGPSAYRQVLFSNQGFTEDGHVFLQLPDYGPGTHCVYIRFVSNFEQSAEDRAIWWLGAGVVVDNIWVQGSLNYFESFEGALGPYVQFTNTAPAIPFGNWARLYAHVTDNDICTENTTCAWLFSDSLVPANDPQVAYGPGGAVVHNWLDNIIQSPWANLAVGPRPGGTVLSFRIFGGNYWEWGRIVQSPSIRSRFQRDAVLCTGEWEYDWWWTNNYHSWTTFLLDLSTYVPADATDLQVRLRVSDSQYTHGHPQPTPLRTGPGPYIDRIRIGRIALTGPVITETPGLGSRAQDAFPSVPVPGMPGRHEQPTADRFGPCAFTAADDLGQGTSSNLITGDSIVVRVSDVRDAGGITAVRFCAAIVAGPHAGKAPFPYVVGANGFFEVPAEEGFDLGGNRVPDTWWVDLDDDYFRGGDVLHYFWYATDAGGGFASFPRGLAGLPASIGAAQLQTGGLLEVSFLPVINWSPTYLARVAADPNGDVEPTAQEIDASSQRNCILLIQEANSGRRAGDRTSFMHTLDILGYRDHYDVYDVQGPNGDLGGRASVPQMTGYPLLIHDGGSTGWISDGSSPVFQKIDQELWYREYINQSLASEAGRSGLWLIGDQIMSNLYGEPLATVMGVSILPEAASNAGVNPRVRGLTSFTSSSGQAVNFVDKDFFLNGGCPGLRRYDGLEPLGTAVATHRHSAATGELRNAAVVMSGNAALRCDTVAMPFSWFDIYPVGVPTSPTPKTDLASRVLWALLPPTCIRSINPTDAGDDGPAAPPLRTQLLANVPNPFNPVTLIPFDLAAGGSVALDVYDVSGRKVRSLVGADLPAGHHSATWDGRSDDGKALATGVYFVQLASQSGTQSRRLVLMK